MKRLLRRILPAGLLDRYHWALAMLAGARYGFPAEKMTVIGVTGTNGKSTTANLIARILEEAGERVGLTTTVNFKVAEREWLNDTKMTMLGRFRLQGLLAQMVRVGCRYAVVETSSEGVKQSRHAAINYDVAVFTNLTPEHLESHGGFENYKRAKGQLFRHLMARPRKILGGQPVAKTAVVNLADPHAEYFLGFPAERKIGFFAAAAGRVVPAAPAGAEMLTATAVEISPGGPAFFVDGVRFTLKLPGLFNVENALAATAAARAVGVDLAVCARALAKVEVIPGRMEFVNAGQPFRILVDYAPEPESFRKLYEVVRTMRGDGRVIHLLGSCGGGRDRDRRPVLGRLAAENADVVIVTNEDPYDDDPAAIIEDVARGAEAAGKVRGQNLLTFLDRGEAIETVVRLARPGDLVIATGKGAEQAICVAHGKKIPWDEREKFREAVGKLAGSL